MNPLVRVIRADHTRKTRLHTSRGELCIDPGDFALSLRTAIERIGFGKLAPIPWLTYPSIRFLEKVIHGRRLFEYGSGSSTAWYAERCSEVFSVENNPAWAERTSKLIDQFPNARLIVEEKEKQFVDCISKLGGKFSAVVIDSQPAFLTGERKAGSTDLHRVACLMSSLRFAEKDCIFVVDNTDVNKTLDGYLHTIFEKRDIHRFPGWIPGNLHPSETTVVVRHRSKE